MEKYRSMSCREGRLKLESLNKAAFSYPSNMQDLRSFSTSYASCNTQNPHNLQASKDQEQSSGDDKSSRRSSSCCTRGGVWSFSDPELQRKKRVATYKVYAVEGKMKGSLKKSFRWIKNTCSQLVYACR